MKRLSALLIALTGAAVFGLVGCSNGDTFEKTAYISGENKIEKIVVQVEDRELEIVTSKDNRIRIDYFDGEKEYLDISVSENKELTVKLVFDKKWTDFIGTKPSAEYRKIKIEIPDSLIEVFSASTTNGDIKVSALSFTRHIGLDTNGGNIICERVSTGKTIDLTAKNGNIAGTIIGGWDDFSISCNIKKGDCNLPASKEGGEKLLTASCNNGNINIEFVK
ncbi:MAG: DUF4097 domain-containing protein [Clostridia bacterium]|nr:DUF4097 domain-containing protein [Clostridia bacterium]